MKNAFRKLPLGCALACVCFLAAGRADGQTSAPLPIGLRKVLTTRPESRLREEYIRRLALNRAAARCLIRFPWFAFSFC